MENNMDVCMKEEVVVKTEQDEQINYKVILKQREYIKFIISNVINRFGDSVDSVAFSWMVYLLTHSATWAAIIFGINRIPSVFLQPIAGAMVERKNKKQVMIVTDILRGVCVGLVAVLYVLDVLNPYILIVITLIISSAEAFRNPASSAFLPQILDKKYYEYAMSLNSSLGTIVELIGLGLAGAIIALGGIPLAIFIDMITFLMSAFIISLIKAKASKSEQVSTTLKESIQALKEGFLYVKSNKVIRTFFLITFLTNGLLVPMNSLQAPLVSEVYHQGELMLSALGITFSIGMLCGSVIYPIVAQKISSKMLMNLGGVVFGIYSIGLIAVEPLHRNGIALYGIVGFMSIFAGIGIAFMISVLSIGFMKNVDEEYIARAGAILNSIAVAAIPIVSVVISILVKVISVQLVFSITGILTIVTFLSFTFNKKLIL